MSDIGEVVDEIHWLVGRVPVLGLHDLQCFKVSACVIQMDLVLMACRHWECPGVPRIQLLLPDHFGVVVKVPVELVELVGVVFGGVNRGVRFHGVDDVVIVKSDVKRPAFEYLKGQSIVEGDPSQLCGAVADSSVVPVTQLTLGNLQVLGTFLTVRHVSCCPTSGPFTC